MKSKLNLRRVMMLAVCAITFLNACTKKNEATDAASSPSPTPSTIETLKSSTQIFQQVQPENVPFRLYQLEASQPANIILSPLSLKMVFSMLYEGAAGKTTSLLEQIFDFKSKSDLNWKNEKHIQLAQAVWTKQPHDFSESYKNNLLKKFEAKINPLKLEAINEWSAQATHGMIPTLLEKLDPNLNHLFINLLYFKGSWSLPFDSKNNKTDFFKSSPHLTFKTEYMNIVDEFLYTEDSFGRWVELSYANSPLSLTLALPKQTGQLSQLEEKLSHEYLNEILAKLKMSRIDLKLPKLNLASSVSIKDLLARAGYDDLFNEKADYSKINPHKGRLTISNILQATRLKWDEQGTEAAAATVVMAVESVKTNMNEPKPFHATEPFFFMIRNKETQQIYFMGRILDPR